MAYVMELKTSVKALLKLIPPALMLKVALVQISVVPRLRCGVETILEMDWWLVSAAPKSARLSVKTKTRKRMKRDVKRLKGNGRRRERPMKSLARRQRRRGRRKRSRMSGRT